MERIRTEIATRSPGYAVLWISAGLLVAGLIALSAGTILVGLLGLLFLGACRIVASQHLNGIEISRPLPARAFVGRSFPIESILTNTQRGRTAADFRMEDTLSPSRLYATLSIPPLRNHTFCYLGKCRRRGLVRQDGWTVQSTYPLGLFESTRRGKFTETSTVLALPRPYLHERLRRYLDGQFHSEPLFANPLADSDDEFRLLREFRTGDPVRAIHWPSSLRATQLQVRQSDPPRPKPPRTCLILHSYNPPGKMTTPETFELVLRIVAGLLLRFRDSETEVDFFILPREPIRLRSRSDFDFALERLALLERKPIKNFSMELSKVERLNRCYIVGDSPLDGWESEALTLFPKALCIDTTELTGLPLSRALLQRSAS